MIPNEVRQREYKLGAEKFGWKEKYQKPGSSPGVVKTGIGCAGAAWPARRSHPPARRARRKSIPTAASNSASACRTSAPARKTVIAVVAAEMLGLKPEQITVKVGDTQFPARPRQRRQHDLRLDFADGL